MSQTQVFVEFYNEMEVVKGTKEYHYLCSHTTEDTSGGNTPDIALVKALATGTGNVKVKAIFGSNVAAERTVPLQFLRV